MHYSRFCSASDMFVTNNSSTFPMILRKCVYNFRVRLLNSSNALIKFHFVCHVVFFSLMDLLE
jgi:hypothetical protein